jgi:GGDEF domain-containing protein
MEMDSLDEFWAVVEPAEHVERLAVELARPDLRMRARLDTDGDEAARRCEHLRRTIAAHPWRPVTADLPVTASIGVATIATGNTTASALLAQADRNLYAAKRMGRNRVVGDP